MPLRARLLDMGEVGAVRAHSLRYALAEGLGPGDDPAVLVMRTASPAIALGEAGDAAAEVDLEACRTRRVPVLRLPAAGGAATAVDSGSLLVSLLLPRGRTADLRLPTGVDESRAWLADLADAAAGGGSAGPSMLEGPEIGGALVLTACLGFDPDAGLAALVRGRASADSGPARPPAQAVRSPAEVAEALLRALEERCDLELVPSVPMPDELDAVYGWDHRLAAGARVENAATEPRPAF